MLILSGRFIGFLPRHIGETWARLDLMREIKPQTYQFQSSLILRPTARVTVTGRWCAISCAF